MIIVSTVPSDVNVAEEIALEVVVLDTAVVAFAVAVAAVTAVVASSLLLLLLPSFWPRQDVLLATTTIRLRRTFLAPSLEKRSLHPSSSSALFSFI